MRVVSLLASATEIVCALEAGDLLVGRSHECDNPEWVRRLPACSAPAFDVSGSSAAIDGEVGRRLRSGEPLYRIDTELIRRLEPDLIVAQSHCEVCAVTPGEVERQGGAIAGARVLSLSAGSVEEIFASMVEIAGALGMEARGEALAAGERARLERLRLATAGRRRPTVAVLEWTDPVYTVGNWTPELVDAAGGELVGSGGSGHSAAIPGERVAAADPEFLIVAPCGFGLDRSEAELAVLERYRWWAGLRAVRGGRVAFCDGNLLFNRSGMTIVRTAETIAEILHGTVAGEPEEGRHWRWIRDVTAVTNTGAV